MTTETSNRRERNKQRMKERIYTAALDLFAVKGFEHTTIDEITERADVARGTFFSHFPNKDALVSHWSARRQDDLERRMREAEMAAKGGTALERCVSTLADVNRTGNRELEDLMIRAWVKAGLPISEPPRTARAIAALVRADVEAGEINPGVDSVRIGNLLRDAYLGALFRQCRVGGSNEDLADELRWTVEVLLHGIADGAKAADDAENV